MSLVYVAGQLVDKSEAKVSVYDHGLLYGDGVFEGIRVYVGKVFLLEEHVDRLYESARAIRLEIPMSPAAMAQAVRETVAANKLTDGKGHAVARPPDRPSDRTRCPLARPAVACPSAAGRRPSPARPLPATGPTRPPVRPPRPP